MKRNATQRGSETDHKHAPSFQAVYDSRKRKVPGLWLRGSRYYAQLRVDLGNGTTAPRRIALAAANLDEAKAELERTRTERRAGTLPATGFRPKFEDFAREYLASATFAQKKLSTQGIERQAINRWIKHLGGVRLDKITPAMIKNYRNARLALGRTARTANLDTVAVRNVLKYAVDKEWIKVLPVTPQLKEKPAARRPLMTQAQFAAILAATTPETTKNAELFALYLRFLALTGSREKEALCVRWSDVDFERETVTIGGGGMAKNHRTRDVDFSPELKLLLSEMNAGRPPDSAWLFPSPQRGEKDTHAKSLRESLNLVRRKAGMPDFGFHDLRHFFASQRVMAGIDFMTISQWLGHSDGGILVGKVYGHLADTHKKAAAQKVTFFAAPRSDSQDATKAIAGRATPANHQMKKSASKPSRKSSPKHRAPSSEPKPRRVGRPSKKLAEAVRTEIPSRIDAASNDESLRVGREAVRRLGTELSQAFHSLAERQGEDAIGELSGIVSQTIGPAMCRMLNEAGRRYRNTSRDGISSQERHLVSCLHSIALSFSGELLEYVRRIPQIGELISELRSWPVLVSTNPRRDIRKVIKNPAGDAAKHYDPVLRLLGTGRLLDFRETRKPSRYQSLAKKVAEDLCYWLKEEGNHRALGLPWLCDYPDGMTRYELPAVVKTDGKQRLNVPRLGDKRAWAIAVRYYLFLTLAPEPWRTQIRKAWRTKREDCFAAFVPQNDDALALHTKLTKIEALVRPAAPGSGPLVSRGGFYRSRLPRLLLQPDCTDSGYLGKDERDNQSDKLQWLHWWETYLQFEPNFLFDSASLHGMRCESGSMSVFRKFTDKILNAFLVGAGVPDGMKKIQSSDQFPRIAGSDSNAGNRYVGPSHAALAVKRNG